MTKQRIVYVLAIAALLLAAAFIFLWSNLDWIVKSAIERYGSQAAGVPVRVRTVSLHPAQGKGAISGLTVANPPGFSASHLLSLGGISIWISPRTMASTAVVIDEIRISAPRIVYEKNESGAVNIDALKKNLGSAPPRKPEEDSRTKKGNGKKLRIRKLMIEKAKVEVRVAALGEQPRTITLDRLEMTDVGGKYGATPDQVGKEVLSAVLVEVSKEVGKAGAVLLFEKGLERALQRK